MDHLCPLTWLTKIHRLQSFLISTNINSNIWKKCGNPITFKLSGLTLEGLYQLYPLKTSVVHTSTNHMQNYMDLKYIFSSHMVSMLSCPVLTAWRQIASLSQHSEVRRDGLLSQKKEGLTSTLTVCSFQHWAEG